jgi:hypothetical protein
VIGKTSGLQSPVTASPGIAGAITAEVINRSQASSVAAQGGGNRQADGRLGDFFYVKDTRATAFSVGANPRNDDGNTMDKSPNADHGGHAEYVGEFARQDSLTATQQLDAGTVTPKNSSA